MDTLFIKWRYTRWSHISQELCQWFTSVLHQIHNLLATLHQLSMSLRDSYTTLAGRQAKIGLYEVISSVCRAYSQVMLISSAPLN